MLSVLLLVSDPELDDSKGSIDGATRKQAELKRLCVWRRVSKGKKVFIRGEGEGERKRERERM
jgi:hypothetical protein